MLQLLGVGAAQDLDDRLAVAGIDPEWDDVVRDLDRLEEITIDQPTKRVLLRSAAPGCAGAIVKAVGVALPPIARQIPLAKPPPTPPPSPTPRRDNRGVVPRRPDFPESAFQINRFEIGGVELQLGRSWTRHRSLLTEPVPNLMHCVRDGVACGVGPVAEALADVIESAANMVLGEIIARRVKIALRARAVAIAGGKGQRQGQQAQAGQSHINAPFAAHFVHPRAIFNIPVQAAGDRLVKLEVRMARAEMLGGPAQTALRCARRDFRDRAIAQRGLRRTPPSARRRHWRAMCAALQAWRRARKSNPSSSSCS